MAENLATKLIGSHLAAGEPIPGAPIALRFDQTLTQDATGTLVMLTLEAMALDRARTELSVQYVDHNLIQDDSRNPDDHLFLASACRRFGVWYSGPGNGVSHPVHMQRFGKPGKTLIGADSHTPAAGALGMLALGAGGADVALAMAGEPVPLRMPEIWGVRLSGRLPDWVSAKDVILEMLRRHGVDGGRGRIIEYYGPGLDALSAMDRHVIANMGTELGATTTVFPSDDEVARYLASEGRGDDWTPLAADPGCDYEHHDDIDLGALEPLIAKPSSPGNVVPVAALAGEPIYQSYIGSSANPGYRDFAIVAEIVRDRLVAPGVSFDVNPTSRQLLQMLIRDSRLAALIAAGARLHQAGCNGCIGMGQAPATHHNSLRTTPRNFPGRSGTAEDRVFLCSPETAAASALHGRITDPRTLDMPYPHIALPDQWVDARLLVPPQPAGTINRVALVKGPNIGTLPELEALPDALSLPVLDRLGDDVSTDEIMPAGARVLPYRSNIRQLARFCFERSIDDYADRAAALLADGDGHALVAGRNYGQGSSREHAALAPRVLGLRLVIAQSFARIHWQNLTNYGVLALTFADPADYAALGPDTRLRLEGIAAALRNGERLTAIVADRTVELEHGLSPRAVEILCAGGFVNWVRHRRQSSTA